jgi:hypothetical protein
VISVHKLVGGAHVAGVLEGDPRVAGLEQHREHLAPQPQGRDFFGDLDLAAFSLLFIANVGCFEGAPRQIVQVGRVGGGEQRPFLVFHHALHEQVGHPVGGVHVVGAAAVVAGVLA